MQESWGIREAFRKVSLAGDSRQSELTIRLSSGLAGRGGRGIGGAEIRPGNEETVVAMSWEVPELAGFPEDTPGQTQEPCLYPGRGFNPRKGS